MSKRALTLLTIASLALIVLIAGLFIRPYQGGLFFVIGGNWYHISGVTRQAIIRAMRECGEVKELKPTSGEWNRIKSTLGATGAGAARPRKVFRVGDWYLADTEFANAEPAVVLLERTRQGLSERADWGGSPGPLEYDISVWDSLLKQAPSAPRSLVQCFERKDFN